MASQLSADGKYIEGTQFPDPDPNGTVFGQGSTTLQYSVLRSSITMLAEAKYDDATGTGRIAPCTIIYTETNSVVVNDEYDTIHPLWQSA